MSSVLKFGCLFAVCLLSSQLFAQHEHDFGGVLVGIDRLGAYESAGVHLLVIGEGIDYDITSTFTNAVNKEVDRLETQILLPFADGTESFTQIFSPPAPAHDPNHASGQLFQVEFQVSINAPQTGLAGFAYNEPSHFVDVDGDEHELVLSPMVWFDVRKRGDANGDNLVDFADFLILSGQFGQELVGYDGGDFDLDGVVGFADYLILSAAFGT
jgi:hypothetical protein